tara:strand:- start:239 stop:850 length:612 start_codon:yes stop_codon:yes gene_type:complete
MYKLLKRLLDLSFGLIILLFITPAIITICLASIMIHGFPIFFIHERLGLNGKPFKMIKFRSMLVGPSISAEDDVKRITKLGRLLRKTSLDEVPVLLNVIKGDMSLVGPRPMPLKYLKRFNDNQIKRLNIKPGITGLAQISGRNNLSWEKKFSLDIKYLSKKSFSFDIYILLKTFMIVFKGTGVNSVESEIMPEFMGNEDDNNK